MKLSIVIPIYNVAEYINRCLDSIYITGGDISENEFEVICINDGSKDNSSSIVRSYQTIHSNLIYIEQENQGVSVARNKGIDSSNGEYLMFVDPDDAICKKSLVHILQYIKKWGKADMVICHSFKSFGEYQPWSQSFKPSMKYSSKEILDKGYLRTSVWGGLYRKTFIDKNKIRFLEGVRNGEDTNFTLQTMYFTNNIVFEDIRLYNEIGREGSASRTFTTERIKYMVNALSKINDQIEYISNRQGNRIVLAYMMYSPLTNVIADTLITPKLGLLFLLSEKVQRYCCFKVPDEVLFLRNKMKLISFSMPLFYVLSYMKYIIKRN